MLKILCQSDIIKYIRIDIDGVLAPLVKQLVETALEAELDSHITQDVFNGNKNRKNGKTSKTIKSTSGTFELNTPRDRAGSFEPQLVKKNQSTLSTDIEERILLMYGLGLSYRDIIKPKKGEQLNY